MTQQFDVVVLGAGPAGTLAAERAAELGAKTALLTRGAFGGMAANEGPIPVRTLAQAARLARDARQLSRYGIGVRDAQLDFQRLVARANEVVLEARNRSILRDQIQTTGVTLFENTGFAAFADPNTIVSERAPDLRGERIVICTGGVSRDLDVPGAALTVTPAAAFHMTVIPESLLVIGAGATGVQVASIFNALGSKVVLAQAGLRIIPSEDADVSAEVARAFREDGMTVYEDCGPLKRFDETFGAVRTIWQNGRTPVEAQYVVVAVGWTIDTSHLHLEAAGVVTDARGFIQVDEFLRTSAKHIYAAGDVIGRSMLVPQAVNEGYVAGTNAAGRGPIAILRGVEPIGSFTDPEYAKVGLTETEAWAMCDDVLVSTARYDETTRPIIDGRTRGFCKLVIDRESSMILGCHIVGERAVEVAQMAAIAMTAKMRVEDFARILLSFPTYANVLGRAAIRAARQLGDERAVEV
jgi:pyruvate/2-oxoglutarate dehydrogenase complex dihydrolipoamide dehydrogenase (E3) component